MAKKKLSTAEILAAARKADGKGGSAEPEEKPQPETEAPQAQSAGNGDDTPSEPKKAAAKPAASGERPSVKDILAMARQQDKGAAAPAKKEAAKPAAKPAAKTASKPAAEKPAAKGASAPRDTASILAAARKQARPGPMSKAEAAAKTPTATKEAKPKPKPTVPPRPERPAYLQPKPAAQSDETRRSFFGSMVGMAFGSAMAVGFTALAATNFLWLLGLARFMFPNVLIEPPMQFKIGEPGDFAPGTVDERFKASQGVWVVNTEYKGQRQIFALKTVCTNLGCTPNWLESEQKYKCPCHGSGFYKDDINFEGPAPRPLERFAIDIASDGQIEVDKSRTFQEEMGQWTDPDSFISV